MTDTYSTTDWTEILWLIWHDATLLTTDRISPRSVAFEFLERKKCANLVMELKTSDSIEAGILHEILDAIRTARTMVRQTPDY